MNINSTEIQADDNLVNESLKAQNVPSEFGIKNYREGIAKAKFLESIDKSELAKIQKVVQKLQSSGIIINDFELSNQSQIEDIYIAFSVLAKFVDSQSGTPIAASTAKGYLSILKKQCTSGFKFKYTDPSLAKYSFSRLVLSKPEMSKQFINILTQDAQQLFEMAIVEENQRVEKSNQPKEFEYKRISDKSGEQFDKSFLFATLSHKYVDFETRLAADEKIYSRLTNEVFVGEITQFFRETANRFNMSGFLFSTDSNIQNYRDLLFKVIDSSTNPNKTITFQDVQKIDSLTTELHLKYSGDYLIGKVTESISKIYDILNFLS